MISLTRVFAIVRRYLVSIRTDPGRLIDCIYWPILDLALMGLVGNLGMQQGAVTSFLPSILTTTALWSIVLGVNLEICVSLLEEIWDSNLMNIFSTPITRSEWICGVMVVGVLRALLTIIVTTIGSYFLFNVVVISPMFPVFALSLIIGGWFVGFISASFIMYWGDRVQQLAWAGVWLYAVLSSVYCPVHLLPVALQKISRFVPMTHTFQAVRTYVAQGIVLWDELFIAFGLGLLYVALSITFFSYMFEKSRNKGFARRR